MRKSGRLGQRVDPGDGLFERGDHALLVGVLAEPDVAVADLGEREPARRPAAGLAERPRRGDPAADRPEEPRPRPGHALEEPATVDAVAPSIRVAGSGHSIPSRESAPGARQIRPRRPGPVEGIPARRPPRRSRPRQRIHRAVRPGLVLLLDGRNFFTAARGRVTETRRSGLRSGRCNLTRSTDCPQQVRSAILNVQSNPCSTSCGAAPGRCKGCLDRLSELFNSNPVTGRGVDRRGGRAGDHPDRLRVPGPDEVVQRPPRAGRPAAARVLVGRLLDDAGRWASRPSSWRCSSRASIST